MNDRFYSLPEEKQQRIINAGFRTFSQNSYKKSPMGEAAEEAGISKALLFHYFQNKKEYYLFLWDKCAEITMKYMTDARCYEPTNLWEMMERGMRAKFKIMEHYPHMAAFAIKAFYEKETDIASEIQKSYQMHYTKKAAGALAALKAEDFMPGLDLNMMYRNMYWASEGYLWEMMQRGDLDAEQMEKDFRQMLSFWKSVYARRSENECD